MSAGVRCHPHTQMQFYFIPDAQNAQMIDKLKEILIFKIIKLVNISLHWREKFCNSLQTIREKFVCCARSVVLFCFVMLLLEATQVAIRGVKYRY